MEYKIVFRPVNKSFSFYFNISFMLFIVGMFIIYIENLISDAGKRRWSKSPKKHCTAPKNSCNFLTRRVLYFISSQFFVKYRAFFYLPGNFVFWSIRFVVLYLIKFHFFKLSYCKVNDYIWNKLTAFKLFYFSCPLFE